MICSDSDRNEIIWFSSNNSILKIVKTRHYNSEDGNCQVTIKGRKTGTAKITARSKYRNKYGKYIHKSVTVKVVK